MIDTQVTLGAAVGQLSSLGLYGGRVRGTVVGRPIELAAAQQELASAQNGMVCLVLEGEPGIGKTRLLLAIAEMARGHGFVPIGVTADEEIRGPFLLARSIITSPEAFDAAAGTPAERPLQRAIDALLNQDEPGLQGLTPDQGLLRIFDLAALALRSMAAVKPLVILVDDLQWADEDSLRLLRYVVRVNANSPILLALATQPEGMASVNEAVTLLADMGRMGLVRRLKVGRFSQLESTDFLQQVLGGGIDRASAAMMHAQAEGVPFILAEQAHSYRDAGLIQQIDGVWTLAQNAERLLPSAVKTLIQRRVARLPEETKARLAEAAVLGRSFSLRDLHDLKVHLKEEAFESSLLAEALAPAVTTGLLVQHRQGSAADYSFTHGQIRDYAMAVLSAPRRRAIHAAIVEMLVGDGQPSPASLPLLAQHAMAAGQTELGAQTSINAARSALEARAPEEALRLVEIAQAVASQPLDRVALLGIKDKALEMLRRPVQRLEGLAEFAALAEALGDSHLEIDVMSRRAAALRLSGERDRAADIARRARDLAAERVDTQGELVACLELGQNLLGAELGEGYVQAPTEADLDGAEEAFKQAAKLAAQVSDRPSQAACMRELGIIGISRVRIWFIEAVLAGEHIDVLRRLAAGEQLGEILPTMPIAPLVLEINSHFQQALEIYEELGDRRGAMSTVIAMAFISWGPEIHLTGSVKRIEEIRRLMTRMKSLTTESERAQADVQMLYGSLIYAQAKAFPDIAIEKGEEAYAAAKSLGERSLEFASAGGVALVQAEIGAIDEAERWLNRAVSVASELPTPMRARQVESWRGRVRAAAGDAKGMREHLERAVRLAIDQGLPAARCEALARLALESARLGSESHDEALIELAERSAREAKSLATILPGHPPWGAQADAALAQVALAKNRKDEAAEFGRACLAALRAAMQEDLFLDVLVPAAGAIITCGTPEEAEEMRDHLQLNLALLAQRIIDEEVRVRFFRSPIGHELVRLAGPLELGQAEPDSGKPGSLEDSETALLLMLMEGHTNQEIAAELGMSEETLARYLAMLFAKIGASSRADATAAALIRKLV